MKCECGCGGEVKSGRRFIHGHHRRGESHSIEAKEKISRANKGREGKNLGRKHTPAELKKMRRYKHTVEAKRKIGRSLKGRKLTDAHKRKISEANKAENNHRWQGGISFEPYCHKFNNKIKEEVREKYGRTCLLCGKTEEDNGRKLDVHHVDYNKEQGCNGYNFYLVPLCQECHGKITGDREYWKELILSKLS